MKCILASPVLITIILAVAGHAVTLSAADAEPLKVKHAADYEWDRNTGELKSTDATEPISTRPGTTTVRRGKRLANGVEVSPYAQSREGGYILTITMPDGQVIEEKYATKEALEARKKELEKKAAILNKDAPPLVDAQGREYGAPKPASVKTQDVKLPKWLIPTTIMTGLAIAVLFIVKMILESIPKKRKHADKMTPADDSGDGSSA